MPMPRAVSSEASAGVLDVWGQNRPVRAGLARALRLLDRAAAAGYGPADLWLRHQADWLMGWLLNDWRWGEEGNNLRLGWLLPDSATGDGHWAGAIHQQAWSPALPQIRPSGTCLGPLAPASAAALDLPASCLLIAGSTSSA